MKSALVDISIYQRRRRSLRAPAAPPSSMIDLKLRPVRQIQRAVGTVGSGGEQYLQSNITTLFTPRCLEQDFTNNKSSRLTSRHIILHNQDIDVSVKGGHPQLLNGTYLTQKTLVT